MSTNPIHNKPPGVGGPAGGPAPDPAANVPKPGTGGFNVGAPATPPQAGQASPTGQTPAPAQAYESIRSLIADGIAKGHQRQQIFDSVVSNRLREHFGERVSPQTALNISQVLQADPHLASVFNQLYNDALSQQRP